MAALEWVTHSKSFAPDFLTREALRLMRIGFGPTVESPGYPGGAGAACCVSVDFDVTRPERYQSNHNGTEALLRLSEKYEIPLTWAICGKTAEEDPKAYKSILDSSMRHDIAIHTYSHVYADECGEDEYEADVRKCISALALSAPPTTFVFPKNREGHFAMLRRLGFRSFRGAKRAIGMPVMHDGLWNIRPVYYLDQKSLGAESLIKHFIDACSAHSAVFHLWTHPWGITIDTNPAPMVTRTLEPVFAYLKQQQQVGVVAPHTMAEIATSLGQAITRFDAVIPIQDESPGRQLAN